MSKQHYTTTTDNGPANYEHVLRRVTNVATYGESLARSDCPCGNCGRAEWRNEGSRCAGKCANGVHSEADLCKALGFDTLQYVGSNLNTILAACRRHLFLPDSGPIEVVIAAAVANMLPGDPVWPLLVGAPGEGKTEAINVVKTLANVHEVGVLTEASLLSGTPRKEAAGAAGGLLKEIGSFGIMLVKDFGGMLALNRESRGPILAALREIYDGSWTRYVGSDGGRRLTWSGKAGLIGGATPAIDRHYAVMATLGERFVYYRMPESNAEAKARVAIEHTGHEATMRQELALLTADFVNSLDLSATTPELSQEEIRRLIALATFTVKCRSAVDRDTYQNREIELIPTPESPTRFAKVLVQLLRGMHVVGIPRDRAWELITKIAVDSMPALRREVIMALSETDGPTEVTTLANRLNYPTNTTRRVLEDLNAHGIVSRRSQGQGYADLWERTDWLDEHLAVILGGVPEILEGEITPYINTHISSSSISGNPSMLGQPDEPAEPAACQECGSTVFWDEQGKSVCGRCGTPAPEVAHA